MNSAVINSAIPVAILPQGSIPISVKMKTDSSAAVNLKNSVCNKMIAASNLRIHEKMIERFIDGVYKVNE
ncbi:hypothetical protein KACHI17_22330 [Sediminibacterium sp. KACHI17]|uniref:Uncharacterized protein n=1 Tax=Sediminibacterium sp. KACHI17 TaxID=1751071 RepID=A0AAT9GLG4_9BACT